MKLEDLRKRLREEETLIRAIVRLLESDDFTDAWEASSKRDEVIPLIKAKNLSALREWYKENASLSSAGIVGLRKMASYLGIKNYNSYPKDALIAEIARLRNVQGDSTVPNPPTMVRDAGVNS
jgi:hypothetical protein